ncbi:MAG: tetratricopeptide repeat protein [Pseudomonadota bacterium]|nr:tetratricopeptide repeat protein [Pseudomonadota bacterium]
MRLSTPRLLMTGVFVAMMAGCSIAPSQAPRAPVEDRDTEAEARPSPRPAPQEPASEPAVATPLPDSGPAATPSPSPAPAPQPQTQQSPAVVALLSDAEQSRDAGDYRAAQGSLQRAQRIAPRDPEVYYSLAVTHMELEDYDLAEQVALKGVSVAQGNAYQLRRLWQLLAKIRLRAGDPEGSRQAELKANQY